MTYVMINSQTALRIRLFCYVGRIRRPTRSTNCVSSAASDVYKGQMSGPVHTPGPDMSGPTSSMSGPASSMSGPVHTLALIHISEPTRRYAISYAVFCLKKKTVDSLQTIVVTPQTAFYATRCHSR